jgi:excisionase family DNA binding protein
MDDKSLPSRFTYVNDAHEHRYLTPKDLAQRYRVSERQITHLARVGNLPGLKIGKLWRFREEDLQEWEKRQGVQWVRDEINQRVDEIIREVDKNGSV